MTLLDIISLDSTIVGLKSDNKEDIIGELVGCLQVGTAITDREKVLQAVLEREKIMSTGIGDGIAIPHAAVDDLDSVLACMGVVTREEGLAFESIDGQPARLVVLLVIPRAQKLLHIRTLADVARVLSKEDVRGALLGAADQQAAHQVLVQSEG